jgi:hypothetical protein
MKQKENFSELLASENCWSEVINMHDMRELMDFKDIIFTRPCTQINFDRSISVKDIKDQLLSVCSGIGECLSYDGEPYLKLPDYSTQVVEWHYDGISSSNAGRVPDWIFFLHSCEDVREDLKFYNGFNIANCHLLLNSLSFQSRELLDLTSQEIFGHKIGMADTAINVKADLSIKLVNKSIDNMDVLRAHIPFNYTFEYNHLDETIDCYPDNIRFKFKNLTFSQQQYLLNDIQNKIQQKNITFHHKFNSNSLLAVHNKSCFHSGVSIEGGRRRNVYRLQLIVKDDRLKSKIQDVVTI